MSKTNKELYEELNKLLKTTQEALHQATTFANENGLTFDFSIAYGMGGTFYPKGDEVKSRYDETFEKNWHPSENWVSSSQMC